MCVILYEMYMEIHKISQILSDSNTVIASRGSLNVLAIVIGFEYRLDKQISFQHRK